MHDRLKAMAFSVLMYFILNILSLIVDNCLNLNVYIYENGLCFHRLLRLKRFLKRNTRTAGIKRYLCRMVEIEQYHDTLSRFTLFYLDICKFRQTYNTFLWTVVVALMWRKINKNLLVVWSLVLDSHHLPIHRSPSPFQSYVTAARTELVLCQLVLDYCTTTKQTCLMY
jgi:hypothetical protein